MTDEQDDSDTFDMMAGHLRIIAETMLRDFFGERCEDFDEDCECCRRWKLLDALTENPFKESESCPSPVDPS